MTKLVPSLALMLLTTSTALAAPLSGKVFYDVDLSPGPGPADVPLPGYRLQLVAISGDGAEEVIAQSRPAGPDGTYSIDPPEGARGSHRLRIISSTGAYMGATRAFSLSPGRALSLDVPVPATGVVFDSTTGRPVQGARVWLMALGDDGSTLGPLPDPSSSEEHPTQGQVTGPDGLYWFEFPGDQAVRIMVRYPGAEYLDGSSSMPPASDFAPEGPVCPVRHPSTGELGSIRYFTKVRRRSGAPPPVNDHLPLDPASTGLVITVSAGDPRLSRGDHVRWTLKVTNLTGEGFTGDQGIMVRGELPREFRYVPRSVTTRIIRGGSVIQTNHGDPTGNKIITFSAYHRGRPVPFPLEPGDTLEVSFTTTAGVRATPGEAYEHRFTAVSADGRALSRVAAVSVFVTPDPIFDRAALLASVFCDRDHDGRHGPGDLGVWRARVVMDTGFEILTDRRGAGSLTDIPPGDHLVKLDPESLPPGAEVERPSRIVWFGEGSVVRLSWPVRCPEFVDRGHLIQVNPERRARREAEILSSAVRIRGKVEPPELQVGSHRVLLPWAVLELAPGGSDGDGLALVAGDHDPTRASPSDGPDAPGVPPEAEFLGEGGAPGAGGHMAAPPPIFRLSQATGLDRDLRFRASWGGRDPRMWRVVVLPAGGGPPARVLWGLGAPPRELTWDGRDHRHRAMSLAAGQAYQARLEVVCGDGTRAVSAPVWFGVEPAEGVQTVIRGDTFDETDYPTEELLARLDEIMPRLKASGRIIRIEVHTADDGPMEEMRALSARRAKALGEVVARRYGVPASRLRAVGLGSDQPVVPNIGERNRAMNRRVVVGAAGITWDWAGITGAEGRHTVRVDGQEIPVDDQGSFDEVLLLSGDRRLLVELRAGSGAAAFYSAPPSDAGLPRRRPEGVPTEAIPEQRVPSEGEGHEAPEVTTPLSGNSGGQTGPGASPGGDTPGTAGPTHGPGDAPEAPEAPEAQEAQDPGDQGAGGDSGPGWVRLDSPASGFDEDLLARALALVEPDSKDVDAARLHVFLPPKGRILTRPYLRVRGWTEPSNRLYIAGKAVATHGGRFDELVELPPGHSTLTIETKDQAGNHGLLTWPVEVSTSRTFAMGVAHTSVQGAMLGGSSWTLGPLEGHGRVAGLVRAERNSWLGFSRVSLVAALDTDHEPSGRFAKIVDPDTDRLTLGDESDQRQIAASGSPYYLHLDLDESWLTWGSFRTSVPSSPLLDYERTLHGLDAHLELPWSWGRTTVAGFTARPSDSPEASHRAHVTLQATGGAVYSMGRRWIVEGSERIRIVVRDRYSNRVLSRSELVPGRDYELHYGDGRLVLSSPLPTVARGTMPFGAPPGSWELLDGDPVFIEADFEHHDPEDDHQGAHGLAVSQSVLGVVRVTGAEISDGPWTHQSLGLEIIPAEGASLHLDWAHSDGALETAWSEDGGESYEVPEPLGPDGNGEAFGLQGTLDLAAIAGHGEERALLPKLTGFYRDQDHEYRGGGSGLGSGDSSWGVAIQQPMGDHDSVFLEFQGGRLPVVPRDPLPNRLFQVRTQLGYQHRGEIWGITLAMEYRHQPTDSMVTTSAGLERRIGRNLRLFGRQEYTDGGGDLVADGSGTTTTLGASYQLTRDLDVQLMERLRWSGSHGTVVGLGAGLDDGSRVYVQDLLPMASDEHTLLLGASRTIPGGTRTYSEYRLRGGMSGARGQAVMGVGQSWRPVSGLLLEGNLEQSHPTTSETREPWYTVSLGARWTSLDWLELSGRLEVARREDRHEDEVEPLETRAALLRAAVSVTEDLSLVGRLDRFEGNHGRGDELSQRAVGSVAYRPVDGAWFSLLGHYGWVEDREPDEFASREAQVLSLVPMLHTPWGIGLVQKVAVRVGTDPRGEQRVDSLMLLAITRLDLMVADAWQVSGEWRMRRMAPETERGLLGELSWLLGGHVRLAAGYNFTSFSDDEFLLRNEDHGGPYLKLAGYY